jgi:cysteine synthase
MQSQRQQTTQGQPATPAGGAVVSPDAPEATTIQQLVTVSPSLGPTPAHHVASATTAPAVALLAPAKAVPAPAKAAVPPPAAPAAPAAAAAAASAPAIGPASVLYSPEAVAQTGRAQYPRFHDLVGQTPLVSLSHLLPGAEAAGVVVLAKVEWRNPSLSIKDRIVREIFDDAEARGALRAGGTVVAASSGNTAAAVAMLAAARGYRAVIVTSSKCSREKMDAIRAYGARLVVDDGDYMAAADALARAHPSWFNVSQYDNPLNPRAHFRTLGPEVWAQTNGAVTHFVAGGSTGGTVTGTGRFLKERSARAPGHGGVAVVLADPVGSVFAHYHATFDAATGRGELRSKGRFLVEGVGKGNIPGAIDFSVIDEVVPVSDADTFATCRRLARGEGILAGGSGGLNVHAALAVGARLRDANTPATIVTVLPDCGIKYLSKVYNDSWLAENGLAPADE